MHTNTNFSDNTGR